MLENSVIKGCLPNSERWCTNCHKLCWWLRSL